LHVAWRSTCKRQKMLPFSSVCSLSS
jgi:hypothetical protein